MANPERCLVVIMRTGGCLSLLAALAAFLPTAWMEAIHRAAGLGEMPRATILEYLTRSTSALYACHGALVVFLSFDVRRYLPFIRFFACMTVVFGAFMLALDLCIQMPLSWTLSEGPFIIALGAAIGWLAARVKAQLEPAGQGRRKHSTGDQT